MGQMACFMKAILAAVLIWSMATLAWCESWDLDGARVLYLKSDRPTLVDGSGKEMLQLHHEELIRDSVLSENKKVLLLLVQKIRNSQKRVRGYDYSRLLMVRFDNTTGLIVRTMLEAGKPPFDVRHRWIAELKAISDTGATARVRLGEASQQETPYRVEYIWRTLKLPDGGILNEPLHKE